MLQFDGKLPAIFARWQKTVDTMLSEVTLGGPQFLMVDQAFVNAGTPHRRPGLHVDNFWEPELAAHGGGHRGHKNSPARHRRPGGHIAFNGRTELLLLASDEMGCAFYEGEWDGEIQDDGNASHINTTNLKRIIAPPHVAFAGDTGQLLHESIPVSRDVQRTVVRLNCYNATIH